MKGRDHVKKLDLAYLIQIAVLATVYVVAARIGLTVHAVAGFATLVWPPSGIALAVLLILGLPLWPGVFVGAVVANLLTGAPLFVALGIGVGNTLEAVLGAYVLRQVPGFRPTLKRVPDVLALIVVAFLTPMVSATIGVASLALGGIAAPARVGEIWRAWWLGDLIGDLLVAPVLLAWATAPRLRWRPQRLTECAALALGIAVAAMAVFGRTLNEAAALREAYLFFPFLIWAVLRFGQRGGVTVTFCISFVAVWATVRGHGPFVHVALYQSLLALQIFMGVTAATFLVLGASVSERWRAIDDLERAVAEHKRLHEVAAEANRVKSEFLAVMSHELRTPLNAIVGYVDLLQMGVRGPLTTEQQQDLERISRSERSLRRQVEYVLSFAKLEAGAVPYQFADVALDEILSRLEPLVSPQWHAKGINYRCVPVGTDVSVWADPDKLEQILLNLISNAIKFTEVGYVELRSEVGARVVHLAVSDTGPGIPPAMQEAIFEPFVRGDGTLTRTTEGIGLGLSISRQLARAMGGDISVASEVGVGSTFTLVLPRMAAAATSRQEILISNGKDVVSSSIPI